VAAPPKITLDDLIAHPDRADHIAEEQVRTSANRSQSEHPRSRRSNRRSSGGFWPNATAA
jgi:hypothetical protein